LVSEHDNHKVTAGAVFFADLNRTYFEFDGLGTAEGMLDVGKAFVACMDEVFVCLSGSQISAQGVAAVKLGEFG